MRVLRYEGCLLDVPEWCKYVAANSNGDIYAFSARPALDASEASMWLSIGVSQRCGNMNKPEQQLWPSCNASDLEISSNSLTWAIYVLGKFEYMSSENFDIDHVVKNAPPASDYQMAMKMLHSLQKLVGWYA